MKLFVSIFSPSFVFVFVNLGNELKGLLEGHNENNWKVSYEQSGDLFGPCLCCDCNKL